MQKFPKYKKKEIRTKPNTVTINWKQVLSPSLFFSKGDGLLPSTHLLHLIARSLRPTVDCPSYAFYLWTYYRTANATRSGHLCRHIIASESHILADKYHLRMDRVGLVPPRVKSYLCRSCWAGVVCVFGFSTCRFEGEFWIVVLIWSKDHINHLESIVQ